MKRLNKYCRKGLSLRITASVWLILVLALFSSCSSQQKHDSEEIFFSFQTTKGKTVTLAIGQVDSVDYLVYRFGTDSTVELEFPVDRKGSFAKFSYSYYFRGGGDENDGLDLNSVRFKNEGYSYEIFQEYSAKDKKSRVGIRVQNDSTGKKYVIEGKTEGVTGSLINFRFDDRIPK